MIWRHKNAMEQRYCSSRAKQIRYNDENPVDWRTTSKDGLRADSHGMGWLMFPIGTFQPTTEIETRRMSSFQSPPTSAPQGHSARNLVLISESISDPIQSEKEESRRIYHRIWERIAARVAGGYRSRQDFWEPISLKINLDSKIRTSLPPSPAPKFLSSGLLESEFWYKQGPPSGFLSLIFVK